MKKKIAILLAISLLVFSVAGCAAKDTATVAPGKGAATVALGKGINTVAPGKFTVGFDQEFPPMGFVGDDGEFTGFDLDLAAEVADRLGLKLELQPIAWDSKDMELSSKNIDCIWNGFTMNDREDKYTWTDPYMSNNQVFVVRSDSGIETLADLAGKTVAVQVDSSAEAALADDPDLVKSFGDYIKASDYNSALMDLEAGGVDAVAMDEVVANYQIEEKDSKFTVLDEKLAKEEYGVGFLLGNEELRNKVQDALEKMAKDGTMKKISEQWFGKDVTTIGK